MSSKNQMRSYTNKLKQQIKELKSELEKVTLEYKEMRNVVREFTLSNNEKSTGPIWDKRVIIICLVTGLVGGALLALFFTLNI